jgi:ribosomal protein S6
MSTQNTEIENTEADIRTRIYEAGILFIAALGDEGASNYFKTLQDWVTSRGGEIIAEGAPERFDLAYSMSQIRENKKVNHHEAYLAWFKFSLDATLVREFEDTLARDLNIIRKLVFKTVREATYVQRKSARRSSAVSTDESVPEESIMQLPDVEIVPTKTDAEVEVNETELEKKLDELVITE